MTDLHALIELFFADSPRLGEFQPVATGEMPGAYQTLLAHDHHMTVTVERFYGSPVDVVVLDTRISGDRYARKILLRLESDGRIAQFGVMRLNFKFVSEAVRQEVESQSKPLGRILIEHKVLREVHCEQLWRVTPGEDLRNWFGAPPGTITFGRTARIDCDGEPAIELLDIVAPV